jgi:microcystin degradation protein MlrC
MKRILFGCLRQETATFNPVQADYDSFHVLRGNEITTGLEDTGTEIAGILDVLGERQEYAGAPTVAAWAVSGGHVTDAAFGRLKSEILEAVDANRDVDGVCFALHGAMACPSCDDPEGDVLASIRTIVGEVPIVATLDLHAILTERIFRSADILVPYHTYPHTDHRATGRRGARLLIRLLEEKVRPTTAVVSIPMLPRGDELLTESGLFGQAIGECIALERAPTGLAAGVLPGNPYCDVANLRTNVLVTTDCDPALARTTASRLANFMWGNRNRLTAPLTSLPEAIRIAKNTDGLTVFSDAADATSSGAPGDSNAILKGLLEARFSKKALLSIVDAPLAAAAFQAGVGATILHPAGGTLDPERHHPVDLELQVHALFDGKFSYEDGSRESAGVTAVLTVGKISMLVTERPVWVVGTKVFSEHGLIPKNFDLVTVKSPNGFRTYYQSIAARIVPVDVPGATTANLKSLHYRRCERPMFPLDGGFEPQFKYVNYGKS